MLGPWYQPQSTLAGHDIDQWTDAHLFKANPSVLILWYMNL
jgi:hypothetical protein